MSEVRVWGARLLIAALLAWPAGARAQTEAPEVPPEESPPRRPAPPPAPAPVVEPPAPVAEPPAPAEEPPALAAEPPAPVVPRPALVAPSSARAGAPLAGVSGAGAFLRAPDDGFVLFAGGRVQLDGYGYRSADGVPASSFLVRRAWLQASGWIGSWAYFTLAGDFATAPPSTMAAPTLASNLAATDDFVAIAPAGDLVVLQVGQFDAPFTLENRTSDTHLDFMERSITVRAFGIPEDKEVGAMLHGHDRDLRFQYAVGVFDGDGQGFRNVDDQLDAIGRAWIAPFAFAGDGPLHDITIGGSARLGDRDHARALPSQTTQGGFTFLGFGPYRAPVGAAGAAPVQLRQVGLMRAFAGELDAPLARRLGVRAELVWKHSPLSETNVSNPASPLVLGGANLRGWSAYAELWIWLLGDDRVIGRRGLQPLKRLSSVDASPMENGLMLALRGERLDEDVSDEPDAAALGLQNPAVGKTKVTSFEIGLNYWRSRRFRASLNYVYNHFEGDTLFIRSLPSPDEQELGLRLAIAL